jgi:hypothetical protein
MITVGTAVLAGASFSMQMGKPLMGLAERVAILVGLQWTFTLALRMLLTEGDHAE